VFVSFTTDAVAVFFGSAGNLIQRDAAESKGNPTKSLQLPEVIIQCLSCFHLQYHRVNHSPSNAWLTVDALQKKKERTNRLVI